MPDITAVTRDEITHSFPCAETSFVLDAAEAAGLYLPAVCHHGRCGTCWAKVISGRYDLAPYTEAALPPSPGGVLLCRCRPRENLLVQLPCRDAQIGRRHVPERRAVVAAVQAEAGWVALSLRLKRDGEYGQAAVFAAGQYMELSLTVTGARHGLAMANLANEQGVLEFLARPEADAPLAGFLAALRGGAELSLHGPQGSFGLDETSPRPRLLLGAAAGLAPLLALLHQLAANRDRTRMHMIFSCPAAAAGFAERLLAPLRAALPALTVSFTQAHPAEDLRGYLATLSGADLYICGPAQLAEAAQACGVPDARIRIYDAG